MRRVLFVAGLTVMALVAGAVAMVADTELPDAELLQQSSFICGANIPDSCNSTNALAKLSAAEDRENVSLEAVPEMVIHAVVDSEDRYFFDHKGIDPVSISRALYWDLRSGTTVQGGSTITQQYVKNTFLTHEETVSRKIKEAVLAIKVEQSMSKEQILEGYLNTIFFGRNVYGIKAAAQAYFGKDVKDLQLQEASYLAGLIRAPNRADASKNPEAAKDRRRKALVSMLAAGHITQKQYDDTVDLPFDYVKAPDSLALNKTLQLAGQGGGYITSYVDAALKRSPDYYNLTAEDVALGGLRIYTTIDPVLQTAAWDAIYNPAVNTEYPLDKPELPTGALVSIDDKGQVKAMVGGRGPGDGANLAMGLGVGGRPVGSTFKPIVLAEALDEGYSLESTLPAPREAQIPSIPECGEWKPRNAGESEIPNEQIDLMTATKESVNTAYAHLIYELAADNGNSTSKVLSMAESLGMDTSQVNKCLTMVLGANNSTPLEMAEVYSTFANGGVHKEPKVILRIEKVDQKGKVTVIYQAQEKTERVLSELNAAKITNTLEKVIIDGTGTRAQIGRPAAGKTGTTAENKDAWFVGYTPKLTTAVWMGFETVTDWINPECIEDATNGEIEGPYADLAGHPELCEPELAKMGSNGGKPVYDWPMVIGGSMPAIMWRLYMEKATAGSTDAFRQLSEEELLSGKLFETGRYVTGTTVPTTTPQDTPQPPDPPDTSVPDTSVPDTSVPDTSVPDTTSTTEPDTPGFPPPPGNGNGNGNGNDD